MLQKIIFRQLQNDRIKRQQLPYNLTVDCAGEDFDLLPMLPDGLWLWSLVCRDEFRDVEDFRVVEDAWFNLSKTEGFVAVVTAILKIGAVFELFFCREFEDLLADGKLTVNLFLGEAEIDNIEKPWRRSE